MRTQVWYLLNLCMFVQKGQWRADTHCEGGVAQRCTERGYIWTFLSLVSLIDRMFTSPTQKMAASPTGDGRCVLIFFFYLHRICKDEVM